MPFAAVGGITAAGVASAASAAASVGGLAMNIANSGGGGGGTSGANFGTGGPGGGSGLDPILTGQMESMLPSYEAMMAASAQPEQMHWLDDWALSSIAPNINNLESTAETLKDFGLSEAGKANQMFERGFGVIGEGEDVVGEGRGIVQTGQGIVGEGDHLIQQGIGQYLNPTLTPGQQASLAQYLGGMNTATASTMSGLGLGNSTMAASAVGNNFQNEMIAGDKMLREAQTMGLAAAQQGTGIVSAGVNETASGVSEIGAGSNLIGQGNSILGTGNNMMGLSEHSISDAANYLNQTVNSLENINKAYQSSQGLQVDAMNKEGQLAIQLGQLGTQQSAQARANEEAALKQQTGQDDSMSAAIQAASKGLSNLDTSRLPSLGSLFGSGSSNNNNTQGFTNTPSSGATTSGNFSLGNLSSGGGSLGTAGSINLGGSSSGTASGSGNDFTFNLAD